MEGAEPKRGVYSRRRVDGHSKICLGKMRQTDVEPGARRGAEQGGSKRGVNRVAKMVVEH